MKMKRMLTLRLLLFLQLLAALFAGCATVPAPKAATAVPTACLGDIAPVPPGAEEVEDGALLQAALGEAGQGKLCAGRAFAAKQALRVFRVWQEAKAYSEFGSWWSLSRPEGPREVYRRKNAICPEWSALDVLSVCEIKVGAHFVIGPGQSARCKDGSEYAPSPENQVYLPNDTRVQRVFVENCQRLGAWP